jgi:tRNA(Ile)-lysidine synthase TilS/MesJ
MNLSISDNLKKIRDYLQRDFQNRKIVVATSGGIDSIALTFLAKNAGLNFYFCNN